MDELLDTLRTLRSDPSRAVVLYEQLFRASFFVLVKSGSEAHLESHLFLTYPTIDDIRELPVFTLRKFVLEDLAVDAVLVQVDGPRLWFRMLDIVKTGECEVAIDPGQVHGIRLNREMILGMTSAYGPRSS